jgi:hypothetical protein
LLISILYQSRFINTWILKVYKNELRCLFKTVLCNILQIHSTEYRWAGSDVNVVDLLTNDTSIFSRYTWRCQTQVSLGRCTASGLERCSASVYAWNWLGLTTQSVKNRMYIEQAFWVYCKQYKAPCRNNNLLKIRQV